MQAGVPSTKHKHEEVVSDDIEEDDSISQAPSMRVPGKERFIAEIGEGYTFRHLIEYLKNTNKRGELVFSKEGITYFRIDGTNTIMNEVLIPKDKLLKYAYTSSEPEIVVGLTLADFKKYTKTIGKKDGVRLYMLPDDPRFYMQRFNTNGRANVINEKLVPYILPQNFDPQDDLTVTYRRPDNRPNCTVPISKFCSTCSALYSITCNHATFFGYLRGVNMKGVMSGTTNGIDGILGEVPGFESHTDPKKIDLFTSKDTKDQSDFGGPFASGFFQNPTKSKLLDSESASGFSQNSTKSSSISGQNGTLGRNDSDFVTKSKLLDSDFGTKSNFSNSESSLSKNINSSNSTTSQNPPISPKNLKEKIKPKLIVWSQEELHPEPVRIKLLTIKALSKLSNVTGQVGNVKIYMEGQNPVKLVTNIGTYGTLSIYLRDFDQNIIESNDVSNSSL